jgi:hypothetical protein
LHDKNNISRSKCLNLKYFDLEIYVAEDLKNKNFKFKANVVFTGTVNLTTES